MPVVGVGVNHQTAPVEIRDRFAFDADTWPSTVRSLIEERRIEEGVVLSTCNRSEVYASVAEGTSGQDTLVRFVCNDRSISPEEMAPYLYRLAGREAFCHLFRVAAGLNSMVVGEQQVLGQVQDAFSIAREEHLTGAVLNKLLLGAIGTGKRVRTETAISEGAVSVSFAAVELARSIFEDLSDHSAMLIGAGETAELVAQHLTSRGVRDLCVVNRTYERAVRLAEQFEGTASRFEELGERLAEADVVISSTAAREPILTRDAVRSAMRVRRNRPIFFIDIAAPRDIDPKVGTLYNVFLYDMDDLQEVVASNLKRREKEAIRAERIVEEELESFLSWYRSLDVMPTLIELRKRFEELCTSELDRIAGKFEGMTDRDRELVEGMMKRYTNKLLHGPISHVKMCAGSGGGAHCLDTISCLFGLTDNVSCIRRPKDAQENDDR